MRYARGGAGPLGRVRPLRLPRIVDLGSLRRQLVLSTAALSAAVALGMVLVVQLLLAGSALDGVDQVLDARADALISSIDSATPGSTLVVPNTQLDPGIAVYDAHGRVVAGYVPEHQSKSFGDLAEVTRERTRTVGEAFALVARPFATRSGAHGVVVLSERLAPYEGDERDALVVSVVAGVLLVVVATALAAWASRRALAPVATMARTAETWSEHDLERRFDLGPPSNEIRALGQTLDGLLDKVARAIVAEQRLTSELAHELRSPLTAVQGTAELIAMRDDLDPQLREDITDIQESCRHMSSTITSLLQLARSQSTARTEDACRLYDVMETVLSTVGHQDRVTLRVDPDLRAGVPADLAVRAIAPVVDNAVRLAEHVTVSTQPDGTRVRLTVADDGPGVDAEVADRIFVAGHTGGGGSGLGLALARRIARSVGGDVVLSAPSGPDPVRGGATFVITFPALNGR